MCISLQKNLNTKDEIYILEVKSVEENTSQEGKEQNIKETQQVNLVEARQIKLLRNLPDVFMLKTKYGEIIKISVISSDYTDCGKYVSRSKLTFSGCFKLRNGELREVRGIYYTPIAPLFNLNFRGKISRDLEEMKDLIMKSLDNYNLTDLRLLISYDNYSFAVYDKFKKAPLLEFNQWSEQGHLFIYNIPSPKYVEYLEFETVREIQMYNHVIESNSDIKLYRLYSSPGLAYLLYIPEYVAVRITSPDHDERMIDLYSGQYYLIAHPAPIHKVD